MGMALTMPAQRRQGSAEDAVRCEARCRETYYADAHRCPARGELERCRRVAPDRVAPYGATSANLAPVEIRLCGTHRRALRRAQQVTLWTPEGA